MFQHLKLNFETIKNSSEIRAYFDFVEIHVSFQPSLSSSILPTPIKLHKSDVYPNFTLA
jgi:hypothetical protein